MNWVIMPYIDNHDETQDAVTDVLAQSLPVDLLLVDNGSRERLDRTDHRLWHWHHQPALLSLATLWNNALKMVWASGGEYALVVNNDLRLPNGLYAHLVRGMQQTGAWFISACNVGERYEVAVHEPLTDAVFASRGGPDFSCFVISRECHRWFQFDEQFVPAYHEDNDYHRRLQLAGFGDRIFSVPIPYLHYGSGTLRNGDQPKWNERFKACQDYYVQKWGGLPHHETFDTPFNEPAFNSPGRDPRCLMFGQGRNELGLREYEEIRLEHYGEAERSA